MDTPEINTNQINPKFPVVGIATSAPEIDNLLKIIAGLPPDSGMGFLIFEDLSLPQHDSLTELLSGQSNIPVQEIVNEVEVYPDTIYVVPNHNFLIIENGILHLKPITRSTRTSNCVDLFFDALAQKFESYAVGLLLSYSTFDGSSGLKKIKEKGGAAVSAVTKTGFSLSSVNQEFIDYFTTPEKSASTLLEIRNSYQASLSYQENEITTEQEQIFKSIVNTIVLKKATNFHNYKQQTLRRRIAKRMVITKQESAERYLNLLTNSPAEQDLLFNDLLIPVTYFFRDASFFDSLSNIVFPSIVENLQGEELRIWSAGCSTGEEVYSLAICLDEYLQKTGNNHITMKIFASDLSLKCIDKARAGIYSLQDLKNLDEKRIEKYFIKRETGYHVSKIIRDNCVFAVHDLTQDFPFSKIDFISCRNVLIYFNAELQKQVLASFHYALRENGFLFLGKAESATTSQDFFTAVEKKEKIYLRKNSDNRFSPSILSMDDNHIKNKISADASVPADKDFRKIASDILLEHYSPAAVLIKEDFEIVHFHGDISPFLQPPAGKPTFNIINMVHQELRFALKNSILKARSGKKNFLVENIAVKHLSFATSFEIVFLPSHPELLLVIFCRKAFSPQEYTSDAKIRNADKELQLLQGDFRQLSDEQQVYLEELQTTNEELLRRTEELQFLNEKLETSAEELRSNNEELSCTNDELCNRRNELWAMRNFYESIVKTIKEPLLVIDKNFMVHSANPAFYSYFRMREELTEGFSLIDLGISQWNNAEFKENILKKISRNETVENLKIQFDAGGNRKNTILVTAAPIADSLPEGLVLIAFEDITELEQGSESLLAKNEELVKHSRQLETFTAAASHNLLDPVRKIYMFGKKIMDNESALSETGHHHVRRLLSAAANLSQLMEDLIQYSKVNFEEKRFKKTDLNSLLKKAVNDLKPVINARNVVIDAQSLPPLRIIPGQVHVLFTNLISNAVKYSKSDTAPVINISTSIPDTEELVNFDACPITDYIKLSVSDNGTGFSQEFETLVFDPFYKLQGDDNNYGAGLGLTLARQIVSNHKGFIKASSSPGEGTTIHIYLPLEVSFANTYSEN